MTKLEYKKCQADDQIGKKEPPPRHAHQTTKRSYRRKTGDNPTARNYVTNDELLREIVASKAAGRMSDELGRMLLQMCTNYAWKRNFYGYSFREDMISQAITNLCGVWQKFDETTYKNPFAYYTTCIHNSFIYRITDNGKQADIKNALLQEAGHSSMGWGDDQESDE